MKLETIMLLTFVRRSFGISEILQIKLSLLKLISLL